MKSKFQLDVEGVLPGSFYIKTSKSILHWFMWFTWIDQKNTRFMPSLCLVLSQVPSESTIQHSQEYVQKCDLTPTCGYKLHCPMLMALRADPVAQLKSLLARAALISSGQSAGGQQAC